MASGNTLIVLTPQMSVPPSANYATFDTIADASTPNIIFPVLDFDGATDEHADWSWVVPSYYDGGGFTFKYMWAVDGTDVDIVDMEFRNIVLAQLDVLTGDLGIDTQTAVSIQDTPIATSTNKYMISGTGNLSHANAGSPSAGSEVLTRGTRDVSAATNTDDLQLMKVYVTET